MKKVLPLGAGGSGFWTKALLLTWVAAVVALEPCLAQATGTSVTAPSKDQIQRLRTRLNSLKDVKQDFGDIYRGSPAITIATPSGFGADNNTFYVGTSYQTQIRNVNGGAQDAGLGIGFGLFDARQAVGLELNYGIASLTGRTRPFGSGAFSARVSHQFEDDLAVSVGWNSFANLGGGVDDVRPTNNFQGSVFGVVTKVFRTQEAIASPFSRVAFTLGAGNGQFRTFRDVEARRDTVGVFGSVAVRIIEPLSTVVEWTGQDLAAGVSFVPFRDLGFVITPAVRDITGSGFPARFVLGAGVAFRF